MTQDNLEKLYLKSQEVNLGEDLGTINMRYLPVSKVPKFTKVLLKAFKVLSLRKAEETQDDFINGMVDVLMDSFDDVEELLQACVDKDLNEFPGMIVVPILLEKFIEMNLSGTVLKNWNPLLLRLGYNLTIPEGASKVENETSGTTS